MMLLDGTDVGYSPILVACSVVNRALSSYPIIGGLLVRLIRIRLSEEIMEILFKIDWRTWNTTRLCANQFLLKLDLDRISADRLLNSFKQVAK
jgi:hypothetical protein